MKSNRKYVVVSDDDQCLDYRTISEIMTNEGDKMNHASVRNHILRGFTKVAKGIVDDLKIQTNASYFDIAKSAEFQHAIIDIMKRK